MGSSSSTGFAAMPLPSLSAKSHGLNSITPVIVWLPMGPTFRLSFKLVSALGALVPKSYMILLSSFPPISTLAAATGSATVAIMAAASITASFFMFVPPWLLRIVPHLSVMISSSLAASLYCDTYSCSDVCCVSLLAGEVSMLPSSAFAALLHSMAPQAWALRRVGVHLLSCLSPWQRHHIAVLSRRYRHSFIAIIACSAISILVWKRCSCR